VTFSGLLFLKNYVLYIQKEITVAGIDKKSGSVLDNPENIS
jgi:hypothetical protein